MIRIHLPAPSDVIFAIVDDVAIGPFGPSGSSALNSTELSIDTDSITQGIGIYGEKGVTHSKTDGDIYYQPMAIDMVPAPTSTNPYTCKWTGLYYPSRAWVSKTMPYGLVSHGSTFSHAQGIGRYCVGFDVSQKEITKYVITVMNGSPPRKVAGMQRIVYSNIRYVNNSHMAWEKQTLTHDAGPFGFTPPLDFGAVRTIEEIRALFAQKAVSAVGSKSQVTWSCYTTLKSYSTSPALANLAITAFVYKKLGSLKIPEAPAVYGELAMRASAQVNANQVNMIAFLRDLRKPWELIPKLKNFWKLKTLSENYLIFDYGILPTMSDLQDIFRACKRMKPYLDKNGFRTYSASSTTSYIQDGLSWELLQRLKLAVADNDSALLSIIERVDSMGFLLTFENVWDLIPYSFVIDWFLDIGSFLERVDADLRISRLNIRYTTMSYKASARTFAVPTVEFPYSGSIEKVHYHRWVSDRCPVPTSSLDTQNDFDHWIEAGALIIQRAKK